MKRDTTAQEGPNMQRITTRLSHQAPIQQEVVVQLALTVQKVQSDLLNVEQENTVTDKVLLRNQETVLLDSTAKRAQPLLLQMALSPKKASPVLWECTANKGKKQYNVQKDIICLIEGLLL